MDTKLLQESVIVDGFKIAKEEFNQLPKQKHTYPVFQTFIHLTH